MAAKISKKRSPARADAPRASTHWDLDSIVAELRASREITHNIRFRGRLSELPERDEIARVVEEVSAALFPSHYGRADLTQESLDYFVGGTLGSALGALAEQVRRGIVFNTTDDEPDMPAIEREATEITRGFARKLPEIRALLVSDLQAAYLGDPSATSASEILLSYPGMTAVIHYRLAHAMHQLGAALPARLVSDIARSSTGIDIHPAARIGHSFFIDHGSGVVIGETAIIGNGVRLYQAVTLGARSFPVDESGALIKGIPRHPIVEDNVVIYSGATILGRITIGAGSVIGGNVWLTQDVPPGSAVTQAQMRSECAVIYDITNTNDFKPNKL